MTSLRSLLRLVAAGVLGVLAAVGVAPGTTPEATAQGALDDSAAWEPLGAEPQELQALAFSGDLEDPTLWGGRLGVLRLDRIDGSWVELGLRPAFALSDQITFLNDPFDAAGPDTVLAGSSLYRSLDGGATFSQLQAPPGYFDDDFISANGALTRFPADSPYPHRLLAGDAPTVVLSDDGGDTWVRGGDGPFHEAARLHAFRSGRVLSVGFYGAAFSRDGGVTFERIPALYDTARVSFDLTELVVLDGFVTGQPGDSEEGRVLVLGTQAGRPGTHVWASDDEGATWAEIHQFEFGGVAFPAAAVPEAAGGAPGWAVAADQLPGRVFATVDGGVTWVVIGRVPGAGRNADGSATAIYVVEVGPDGRLYAGTSRTGPQTSWSYRSKGRVAEVIRQAVAEEPSPETASGLTLSVRPNPAGSHAEVTVRLGGRAEAVVTVTDARGREVARLGGGVASERTFRLDTSGWASGVYVIRVEAGTEAATAAFTVAR